MKLLLASIGSVLLLGVAAFCVFGFLASFEPTDKPGVFLAFRIGYAIIGLSCLGGMFSLVVRAIRRQC